MELKNETDEMERLLAFVTRNGDVKSYMQLRAYDLQNILVYKSLFLCSNYLKLRQKKDALFLDKCISRCTVRFLDAQRLDWRVIITANNKQARTFDPDLMSAQKWKAAYYDIADEIQAEEVSERIFKFNTVNLTMMNKNSVYSVLSACEVGAPDGRFQIFCLIHNQYFNSSVVDADGKPAQPPVKPPLSLFRKAFKRDMEETRRLEELLRQEPWDV